MGRRWSAKDEELLIDKWDKTSVKCLAQLLNRTETAITVKATKLGLGGHLECTGSLSAAELGKAIGEYRANVTGWIRSGKLKACRSKTLRGNVWQIKHENFWEFAKDNPGKIKWNKFEPGILGKEPDWARNIRKEYAKDTIRKDWGSQEIARLRMYISQGRTYEEIAKRLGRSYRAVECKAWRLRKINN